ncbi:GreA/GreB family elongation factor [Methylohalobius crimeensis]|uniref:GreA/GreB family elongation factor n=1 Tax=Methylohalobius crimeensis TaxID=244365 RepID=UPI0003B55D62|nr:GreA/GreB family elongation factor [Methylohalobius crimeensis]
MSRAFVKEDNAEAVEELPDKPISSHTNYVTPDGFKQLQARLAQHLKHQSELNRRDDLSARQELPVVQREIRYLEKRLESAVVVDSSAQPSDRVHFGAWVEVLDDADKRHIYHIVGEDEADATRGCISWVSPLARALFDARVGDLVTWRRPAGDVELEVIAIHRDGKS